MEVPEKLKNEPPCDPAIPLLGNGIIRWKREPRLPGVCSAVRDNQDSETRVSTDIRGQSEREIHTPWEAVSQRKEILTFAVRMDLVGILLT